MPTSDLFITYVNGPTVLIEVAGERAEVRDDALHAGVCQAQRRSPGRAPDPGRPADPTSPRVAAVAHPLPVMEPAETGCPLLLPRRQVRSPRERLPI